MPVAALTGISADPEPSEAFQSTRLLSRIGHSMLLDPTRRTLFIFAGQRHDSYMSDLWAFGLDSGELQLVSADYTQAGGPDGGFTQRTTIDENGEWLMISGLQKDQRQQHSTVKNSMWLRRASGEWVRVDASKDAQRAASAEPRESDVPRPRYAHQVCSGGERGCR